MHIPCFLKIMATAKPKNKLTEIVNPNTIKPPITPPTIVAMLDLL